MKRLFIAAARSLRALRRPSRRANARLLAARGEALESLVIRDAAERDIPALADLHVKTWRATYSGILSAQALSGPTYEVRERQWREAFARADGSWFALVVERPDGRLVGFAKGTREDPSAPSGELGKIYLLREYQRLGLGRRLVGHVARRFLERGVSSMQAYVDPRNPSCRFFEALGAGWLREPDGRINYNWYVWPDLQRLSSICPIE